MGVPSHWSEKTIKEINERQSSGIEPSRFPNETFELYSVPSFDTKEPEIIKGSQIGSSKQIVNQGDVLICKINPRINRVWVVGNKTKYRKIASSEWIVVNTGGKIDPSFLRYEFSAPFFRQLLESEVSGVGGSLTRARPKLVENYKFPVAPLAEQTRIVAKLDTLFAHLDQLRARLDKIPVLLKQFRQAVLTQAVTGKLTEEWRKATKTSAKKDLQAIRILKARLLSNGSLKGSKLEPIKDEDAVLALIPSHWETCILDDLFRFLDYRGKTPNRSAFGKRFITAKNIKMGHLSDEPIEYMSDKDYEVWMTRGLPKFGDLFFVTEGHTMGNVAINNRTDRFAVAQRTLTLQSFSELQPRFFFYMILTNEFQNMVGKNATGTAAIGIKAARFKNLPVPFPSLLEQREIADKVESLFALADRIEGRYEMIKAKLDRLPQAALSEAFTGDLLKHQVRKDGTTYSQTTEDLSMAAESRDGF